MGLHIVAYEIATLTEPHELDYEDCYENKGHRRAFVISPDFNQSLRGLEANRCYAVNGESFHFQAGSYNGYNRFREALCQAVWGIHPKEMWDDPDPWRNRPFFELINFADNEGTIGPDAAADLAQDFADGAGTVRPRLTSDAEPFDYYYQGKYDAWTQAFELAAGTGMVDFR